MKTFFSLFDKNAWLLIVLGSLLFGARVPLPVETFVNLPFLETAIQICGGMLILSGVALISGQLFWREASTKELFAMVGEGNVAAAVVLAGLKVFNGLALIGFAFWFAMSFGSGVTAQ